MRDDCEKVSFRQGVGREDAEREIIEYVERNPGSDAVDIAVKLRLPLLDVEAMTEDLEQRGVLARSRSNSLGGANMKTNADILSVCREVLAAKKRGDGKIRVGSTTFDDLQWRGGGGRCQENARKAFEAAAGRPMPGKACCAYTTNLNLWGFARNGNKHGVMETVQNVEHGGRPEDAAPGDYLYFRGGSYHSAKARREGHACNRRTGHVGIYMGEGLMWQHTSRGGRAICVTSITASQRKRFCGAYRLLPLAGEEEPKAAGIRLLNDEGAVLTSRGQVREGELWIPARKVLEALGCTLDVSALKSEGKVVVEGRPE